MEPLRAIGSSPGSVGAKVGDGAGRFVVGRYEIIDAQKTPAAPT